jgi:hypothetical protein
MDDPHAQLAIDVTTIHAHGQGDAAHRGLDPKTFVALGARRTIFTVNHGTT